ncbi:MAG TPA: hypothetical protein VM910_16735 [Bradyrhizobium sp.]|jgi:hypothetical protein|nr:hypothetical protein [Bradyrhizobium sp.]
MHDDSNVRTLTTRYQQILDAYKRMWESIPVDADGCKHAPVCDDEMPDYLSHLVGRTVTAAEWQAAQRWEWEQIAGGKIVAALPRPAEVSVQIDDYQDALQRLIKRLVQLLGHPTIANLVFADYEFNEDQYWLHTLGELEAAAKLMLEFAKQAPATLYVMRGSLERLVLAPDLVMNEATRTAYRATIEALDRTQAALGVPLAERSRHFEVKRIHDAPAPPPPPDANPELQQMSSDELRAALTDTRIRSEAIETEISRRGTAAARALAVMLVSAREPPAR